MKNLYYYSFILCVVFFSCSKENSILEEEEEQVEVNKPVAVDDSYDVFQNTEFLIQDMLSNDAVFNFVRVVSFDEQTKENGTIESRGNNSYLYSPPSASFLGTDSFTYTICDDLSPSNCSTATVTVNVKAPDTNGSVSIILRDDQYFSAKDVSLNIASVFENDFFQGLENATISRLISDKTNGTVTLLENNGISYTPTSGFTGTDTFEYEVCSSDNETCETGTVLIKVGETTSYNIPSNISDYYKDALFFTEANLLDEFLGFFTENNHKTKLTYIERHNFLYDADADLSNANNVILIYSSESRFEEEYQGNGNFSPQTFNTEHVYPQSFLDDNQVAIADLHLLRVCDASINTSRSNLPFIEGSGDFKRTGSTGWYPGDEWRGDVARIVFYVNLYYDEPISDVGTLEVLLKWNAEDPVSDLEKQRNEVIFGAQGNRNPFIDNPYLATLIWGGDPAENKWE